MSRLKLAGQIGAVGLVMALLGLLVWKAPLFQAASERYRDRVVFIGVDTADFSGDARQFLDRYGVRYANVRDPDTSVLDDYGGLPIPRTYVIDRTWTVSGYIYSETREETIRSAIEEALAK